MLYLDDHPDLKKKSDFFHDPDFEERMKQDLADEEETAPMPNDFVEVPYEEDE